MTVLHDSNDFQARASQEVFLQPRVAQPMQNTESFSQFPHWPATVRDLLTNQDVTKKANFKLMSHCLYVFRFKKFWRKKRVIFEH